MKTEHQRTALITGANKGIGKEIARQLAQRGFAVFIGSRDITKGREAAEELCQQGYESTFIQLDVTDPVSIRTACGTLSQKADHLDVLINNAAVLEDHGETILKLNAEMLDPPTKSNRWPVMMFSHGLAGNRNLYSHVCGSMASYGLVVIAMDHRDGSSPVQYIRATADTPSKIVDEIKISHSPSPEVYAARDKQLRIRCYEASLIHAALLKIDNGEKVDNLDDNTSHSKKERVEVLSRFANQLDVQTPGRITWAGHSFGACTTIQFLKSVSYAKERPQNAHSPLIVPTDPSLTSQITPASPVLLLDLWTLPLRSPTQSWLFERPLPSYTDSSIGGKNILSIMSQAFFKWTGNFNDVRRAIAPPKNFSGAKPHLFYPATSQHFSQSDFGVLFPFLTSKLLKTEDPERILLLNTRAMLQVLRDMDIEVADVGEKNLEGEKEETILKPSRSGEETVKGWVRVAVSDAEGKDSGISIEQDKKQKPSDDSEGMDM
ncbi:MAG: SDR family NAD(P)-dependent oxidoreductase [Cytophagaceae bacterium]|nr:MAG: SDR family NAD(P)-dependent oxidoreductase [Cytophagaceae bacterium]